LTGGGAAGNFGFRDARLRANRLTWDSPIPGT